MKISFLPSICIHRSIILIFIDKKYACWFFFPTKNILFRDFWFSFPWESSFPQRIPGSVNNRNFVKLLPPLCHFDLYIFSEHKKYSLSNHLISSVCLCPLLLPLYQYMWHNPVTWPVMSDVSSASATTCDIIQLYLTTVISFQSRKYNTSLSCHDGNTPDLDLSIGIGAAFRPRH